MGFPKIGPDLGRYFLQKKSLIRQKIYFVRKTLITSTYIFQINISHKFKTFCLHHLLQYGDSSLSLYSFLIRQVLVGYGLHGLKILQGQNPSASL